MDFFNKDQSQIFNLEVDATAKNDFIEMSRWTKFLAVMGFVMMALILLLGIFIAVFIGTLAESYGGPSAKILGGIGGFGIILLFLMIAAIHFYPAYALLRYSSCIKAAIIAGDKMQFNRALAYLKNMFKYIAILWIIALCLWGLRIVLSVISML